MSQHSEDQKLPGNTATHSVNYWLMAARHRLLLRAPHALDYLALTGLAVISGLIVFFGLGDYGIINGNESLYIESAREMLSSGDLVVPTLNGLPYLEKPPLYVWLLAIAKVVFGSSEFAARSVTALATLSLVLTIARFSVLLGIGSTGAAAGFILITSLGIDLMSRVAMPDMLLTTLFSAACLNLLLAVRTQQRGHIRLCAGLLGAATMVKGPLSLALFALIAVGALWLHADWRKVILRLMRDPWAALLLFTPIILWLAAIEAKQPGAVSYYIVNEHILRFFGTREPHDYYSGSIFYYIPRLFLFFFPWVGVLAFGWAGARRQDHPQRNVLSFLWLCVWVPFGFFTLSSAKSNYYVLLCLPPMALLTANYLPALLRERRALHLTLAIAVPVMVLVALLSYRAWAIATGRTHPIFPTRDGSGLLTIIVVLVLTLITLAVLQAGWRRLAVLCLGGLIAPITIQIDHIAARAEPFMSARKMATYIQGKFPSSPVFLYQGFEDSGALPIYLDRTIPVIDSRSGDLYYGRRKYPGHPNFVTEDQTLAAGHDALIVVTTDREQDFARTKLKSRVVPEVLIGDAHLYRILE